MKLQEDVESGVVRLEACVLKQRRHPYSDSKGCSGINGKELAAPKK